jgi:hypothetical protein
MHSIEIYGFADRELCAGCSHEHGAAACGDGACAPGAKKPTRDLVAEFTRLIANEGLDVTVAFYEATDDAIARHADVQKLLGMADLSPAIVMDGKLLFLGGFSPQGLLEETKKRLPPQLAGADRA